MELPTTHEQEVQELFEQVTVDIPGFHSELNIRAISLDGFKEAIKIMMNKAYHYGNVRGIQEASELVDNVFTH